MEESRAKVSCQVAACQKAHKRCHDIDVELARREAAVKAELEAAVKAAAERELASALIGPVQKAA